VLHPEQPQPHDDGELPGRKALKRRMPTKRAARPTTMRTIIFCMMSGLCLGVGVYF